MYGSVEKNLYPDPAKWCWSFGSISGSATLVETPIPCYAPADLRDYHIGTNIIPQNDLYMYTLSSVTTWGFKYFSFDIYYRPFYVQYKLLLIVCRGFVCRDTVLVSVFRICIIFMRIRIRDPKNVHTDPDPRGLTLKKKNYTNTFSTKSFKITLKNH